MKILNDIDYWKIIGGEMDGDFSLANQSSNTSCSSNNIGGRDGGAAAACSFSCNISDV